jgi:hypothetical protein
VVVEAAKAAAAAKRVRNVRIFMKIVSPVAPPSKRGAGLEITPPLTAVDARSILVVYAPRNVKGF